MEIETPPVDPKALQVIREETQLVLARFHEIKTIDSAAQYEFCGEAARDIATLIAKHEASKKPVIAILNKAHKDAVKDLQDEIADLVAARAKIKALQEDWLMRQRAAERTAELEAQRLKAERRALLEQASVAEHEGQAEVAQALDEEAEDIQFEIVKVQESKPVPVVKGQGAKYEWKHRVINAALVPFPSAYWVLDESKIASVVKALGPEHGIPGVEAYEQPIAITRRR